MLSVRLKKGRERALQNRHPWVFSGAIQLVQGSPQPGDVVNIVDSNGAFQARGYYNPASQITIRILTWDADEAIDETFWRSRLRRAIARRKTMVSLQAATSRRLVYAESDDLPGLIVDQYGDWLVLQSLTAGIDQHKQTIADLLLDMVSARGVYERSDVDVRPREGLPDAVGVLAGEAPAGAPGEPTGHVLITEMGQRFLVDVLHGHKTGFYLDQRANRERVAAYCSGAKVLNAFSYTGSFGVYAARAGASRIVNLDSSAEALAMATKQMALNGLAEAHLESIQGDAFAVLRTMRDQARRFDVIILDPPKFAFSRAQLQSATRGYKDINLQAMHLLNPGGILATFSCSGAVDAALFQKVLFGAALDAQRSVRILETLSQAADHPVSLFFPEAAYLKGFVCAVD